MVLGNRVLEQTTALKQTIAKDYRDTKGYLIKNGKAKMATIMGSSIEKWDAKREASGTERMRSLQLISAEATCTQQQQEKFTPWRMESEKQ